MMAVWIGTSGYAYDHWRGIFYPEDLPRARWLSHYASAFQAVELNITFYRTPQEASVTAWHRATPAGFRFVLKGSRFLTHIKRLQDAAESLGTFFGAARPLGAKLAAVLWQLPPRFRADPGRLDRFLAAAERSAAAYVRKTGRVRHAVEFRDRSWFDETVYQVLRRHDAALVMADAPFRLVAGPMKRPARSSEGVETIQVPVVGSWMYVRRHGPGGQYGACYPDGHLRRDAEAIAAWGERGDVLVFFNNDYAGYAVRNAMALGRLVAGHPRATAASGGRA
ncbi:MAG: DUF72 domain-containing protein [Armatimonadetes bacterium]|nr:DUF72 domain-containing protein [Armatimonadota bacterium]